MSADLIVFDPSDLDHVPADAAELVEAIHRFMAGREWSPGQPPPTPSAPIAALLGDLATRFGQADGTNRLWISYQPDGDGRYCNFNLNSASDYGYENTLITFAEGAGARGLVLIDPQGRMPVITAPSGCGLFDAG